MSISRIVVSFALAVTVVMVMGLSSEVVAQESDAPQAQDMEESFNVGGSCAALAYLGSAQLKAYIGAGYTDDFHSFCYPEEPSECSDYSSFLKGLGRLVTGDDGYHCSLQLQF